MEKGRKKGGSIVLVAELEKEKEMKIEVVESTLKVYENKGKGMVAENEDSLSQNDMDDIDEHLAFLSRRFSKLKFKKNFGAAKPNRNMVDKSKFKCFKYGLAGHFATDGLDEDEDVSYVNLALMAKSDETKTSSSSNQDELTESLKKEEILKKQLEREHEVIKAWKIFRDVHAQITKVQGIESFYDAAWKRNKEKLESNLVEGLLTDVDSTDDESHPSDNQKDYPSSDINPYPSAISKPLVLTEVKQLLKAGGVILNTFEHLDKTLFSRIGTLCPNLYAVRPLHSLYSTKLAASIKSPQAHSTNSLWKEDMGCLTWLYREVERRQGLLNLARCLKGYDFILLGLIGESSQVKKERKVNVGHLSIKQLSDRLEKIEVKTEAKNKNNRNGKVGINKHNNYTPDKYAPRKICVKCGSVNYLSVNCKTALPTSIYVPPPFPNMNAMPSMPLNAMSTHNMNAQFPNMPFAPNPYYAAFSIPQMPFNMPYWNNMFTNSMPFLVNQNVHDNSVAMNGFKGPTQMTKDESNIPKSNEIKPKKQKKKANKFKERAGPSITFGDDIKGYTVGYGLISKDNVIIEEVALVDGVKHNLLSINQLCDKGN
ncbi:hypothetical protein AgCh_002361 [Apium graveolens]